MRTDPLQLKRPSKTLPVLVEGATYMPGSQTTQGHPGTRTVAPVRIAFRHANGVGALN